MLAYFARANDEVRSKKNDRFSLLFAALILMYSAQPWAQEAADDALKEIPNFFALPIELEFDSGAQNGDASILRFMPLYSFPSFNKWKLVNLDLLTLADAPGGRPGWPGNPEPIPGEGNRVFGLTIIRAIHLRLSLADDVQPILH